MGKISTICFIIIPVAINYHISHISVVLPSQFWSVNVTSESYAASRFPQSLPLDCRTEPSSHHSLKFRWIYHPLLPFTRRYMTLSDLMFSRLSIWGMSYSGMSCRVVLVRSDDPEELQTANQLLTLFLSRAFIVPWSWRRHIPLKRWFPQELHGAT